MNIFKEQWGTTTTTWYRRACNDVTCVFDWAPVFIGLQPAQKANKKKKRMAISLAVTHSRKKRCTQADRSERYQGATQDCACSCHYCDGAERTLLGPAADAHIFRPTQHHHEILAVTKSNRPAIACISSNYVLSSRWTKSRYIWLIIINSIVMTLNYLRRCWCLALDFVCVCVQHWCYHHRHHPSNDTEKGQEITRRNDRVSYLPFLVRWLSYPINWIWILIL